jgi:hypothetical protein
VDSGVPITVNVTKTDILCEGNSSGSITLGVTGGTSPYTYAWSPNAGGATTSSVSKLPKGNYNVTITEGGVYKCESVQAIEIIEPEFGIQTTIVLKENSGLFEDDGEFCQGDKVNLMVSALPTPGSTILSYLWNDKLKSTQNQITVDEGGTYQVTVTDSKGCTSIISKTINSSSTSTVGNASSSPSLCVNSTLTTITHATTGATGIGTAIGLPDGVTATWTANTISISGTPTDIGIFNYSIPVLGSCSNLNATGKITIVKSNTVSIASSSPILCNSSVLTALTHTTGGATGIGTALGLPIGVNASWANNVISISGTPTESGIYNYRIPLTGGCGEMEAIGTIQVREGISALISAEEGGGSSMNDGVICLGDTVLLIARGGSGYLWRSGETSRCRT